MHEVEDAECAKGDDGEREADNSDDQHDAAALLLWWCRGRTKVTSGWVSWRILRTRVITALKRLPILRGRRRVSTLEGRGRIALRGIGGRVALSRWQGRDGFGGILVKSALLLRA